MRTILCFVCVVVCLVPLSAQKNVGSPQPQRLRVAKGESYKFASTSEVENRVTMMGSEQISTMTATAKSALVVVSTSKDSSVFATKLNDLQISMKGMAMMGVPDTTMKLDSLPEASSEVTVLAGGKFVRNSKQDDDISSDKGPQARMMRQVFGSGGGSQSLFLPFPDKPLAVGDEWTDVRNDTTKGDRSMISNITMRYTYEGTCDTLGMKCGRVKARSERYVITGSIKQMGAEMSMEGDGVIKETHLFELKTGVPVIVDSMVETDQRISLGEGMEIPISMTNTTRRVRVK
jgi:hypothetical protein